MVTRGAHLCFAKTMMGETTVHSPSFRWCSPTITRCPLASRRTCAAQESDRVERRRAERAAPPWRAPAALSGRLASHDCHMLRGAVTAGGEAGAVRMLDQAI